MKTSFICLLTGMSLLSGSLAADSQKLQLGVDLAHPNIPANRKFTTYIKVGLTGFEIAEDAKRAPVNVALVIDKSGSMGGDKIKHARDAAKEALDRLGANDLVSVITYDDKVQVIAPASSLSEREAVKAAIDRIEAGGSTALFAGVSKGSEELRKNKLGNGVNRIVLLSDGMANVGPSSPQELGRLGMALGKESVSVSTLGLGLGYNEDLMTELALRSDGNHAFIENADSLAAVFQQEFGDILSVAAQRLEVRVRCAEGVRPVRVLGRDADIRGSEVTLNMNQIYARQHKYVLLEVELPEGAVDTDAKVADVEVSYVNAITQKEERQSSRSVARRAADAGAVASSMNKEVMVEVAKFIATEKEEIAVKLSDEGRRDEALKAYTDAANWTQQQGKQLQAPELEKMGKDQLVRQQMLQEGGDRANAARKLSKEESFGNKTQNSSSKSLKK